MGHICACISSLYLNTFVCENICFNRFGEALEDLEAALKLESDSKQTIEEIRCA
jgi:hypothetical protein